MHPQRSIWVTAGFFGGLLSLTLAAAPLYAVSLTTIKTLRSQAELFEQQSQWDKACLFYEKILQHRRDIPDVRERYQHCLRRYYQACRHRDPSYLKEVLKGLDYARSLKLYKVMSEYLAAQSLDRQKATPERMFQKGVEEFYHALANSGFQQAHLAAVPPEEIESFRVFLKRTWGTRPVYTIQQAVDEVRDITISAIKRLKLGNGSLVVMEFVCGSCYAVDDYTMYLTPAELRNLCDSLRGEIVGIGVTLGARGDKIEIREVLPDSPAAEEGLENHLILSIDGKLASEMTVEIATEMLQGPAGTDVELVVQGPMSSLMDGRLVTLRRRPVFVPSVSDQWPSGVGRRDSIGYIKIRGFQETTIHELDAKVAALLKSDIKALVLDIRGNSGGLVNPAIATARRFLPSGVIVTVQTVDSRREVTHQSRNANAVEIPLVLLVDGDTASAAEILAGALKENQRARLVGQTTFGKGCIQAVLRPAPRTGFPGGLRITISRFLSPNGLPYTGRGVEPHLIVEQIENQSVRIDQQLQAALDEAQRLINPNMAQ